MRATIESCLCDGCGACEVLCPEVFRIDRSNGRAVAAVRVAVVPHEAKYYCLRARDACERGAIQLHPDLCARDV